MSGANLWYKNKKKLEAFSGHVQKLKNTNFRIKSYWNLIREIKAKKT